MQSHRAHESFRYLQSWQTSGELGWDVGVAANRFDFDPPRHSAIPDHLGSVAFPIGVHWKPADQRLLTLQAQPGLYGDFEDISGDDFNVPVALGAIYSANTNLQ